MEKNYTKTIIIGAVIIAVSIIISQSMKQNSIEKQQRLEIALEQEKITEQKRAEELRTAGLNLCLSLATDRYWEYMELNGTKKDDGTVWAQNSVWDRAEKQKQTAIDNCYKKYNK
jgi:hypothetical protein